MCMGIPANEKMGDRTADEEVQILECHIENKVLNTIKQEKRPDDAEIQSMAEKIQAKMAATANQVVNQIHQQPQQQQRPLMSISNNGSILNYISNRKTIVSDSSGKAPVPVESKILLDDESQRGRFGWISFNEVHIPYIFRGNDKYCAVRILESKLLNKYLSYLHSDIYSCTCIRSYYITESESKLFNEINIKHCETQYGREQFTGKDLVVRLKDAQEFYSFLDVCYTKLTTGANQNALTLHKSKCGFIRINKESVVPYTIKDNLKYVPLFYFEGETDNLKLKAEKLEGWDLSYLKFCCKVQGIRNELFASETCSVISLNDIKSYFAPGTGFEDYWPSKVMDSQLLVSSKGNGSGGGWTRQPSMPPAIKSTLPQSKISSINTRGAGVQSMVSRNTVSSATLQRVGQQRPVVTSHPVHAQVTGTRNIPVSQSMMNAVQTAVNGWSGLIGGQQAFQTLVSQPNNIMQMSNVNLHNVLAQASNKSYSTQQSRSTRSSVNAAQYQVYPTTSLQQAVHVQQQPPPLVRSNAHASQPQHGSITSYPSNLAVPSPGNTTTYPQMLGLRPDQTLIASQSSTPTLIPNPNTPPISTHQKYPPPLIPVNGGTNNTRDSRGRKPLIPIAEHPISHNCQVQPYQVQKALVEDKLVPCINFKPYIYTELLMTLPEFISQYFPSCDVDSSRQVLQDVLNVELYQGNRAQMEMLLKNGKCSSLNAEVPLIPVKVIMKYMPQLKYMFNNRNIAMTSSTHSSSEEHATKKRQRTS